MVVKWKFNSLKTFIGYLKINRIKNLSTLKGLCFIKREYNISMKDIIYNFCGNVVNKDLS